jgi:Tol biopolymer transport system component/tRNA A-37 threonylcarbamoyl transferase component Bud32
MTLTAGDTLGPYEIIDSIDRGGMGEVYRARDRRLQREVAIKVSMSRFSERFEREARAIAALNHPNVCTLFDVGPEYLVMELVEGVTLSDRISIGPLPLDDALPIARQIAEALEAAHEHRIVHRDLKPGNVKIRPDGMVKVLDFGLAKQFQLLEASEETRTVAAQATQAGTIVGTAAYMSPEQATGHPVDRRADIWAFGVVLHEMVTGRRPFGGQTTSEILANVIAQPPDLVGLPDSLSGIVEKCLRKDPRTRWQWIGDVRLALDETAGPAASIGHAVAARRTSRTLAAAAILCALGFAAVSALYLGRREPVPVVTRFTVPIPGTAMEAARFELSPNGRMLAIASIENGRQALWLRPLDSLQARLLPGTDGAELPFWSPDSAHVGFFADGRLMRVPIAGGTSSIIAQIGPGFRGASWNDEGTIVYASGTDSLHRVDSAGGTITLLRFDGLVAVNWPRFLPGGRHLLLRANRYKEAESGINAGALDGSAAQHVSRDFSNAAFARSPSGRATGQLLFMRGDSLVRQPFDPQRLQLVGDAIIVAESVAGETGRADFSLSNDGTLAYRSATLFQLTWVDRAGAKLSEVGSPGPEWAPGGPLGAFRLSPDESKLAYARRHAGSGRTNSEVWQLDLLRNVPERLTFAPGPDLVPVWSPDSTQVVYASNRDEATGFDAFVVSAGSEERAFAKIPGNGWPLDWSPDASVVLVRQDDIVWVVPSDGTAPSRFLARGIDVARFAPDGRWVAYVSNESGQNDVYVRPFPGPGSARRVSGAGGTEPQWRRDGRELFYVAPDGTLMAVPVTSDGTKIQFERPVPLFASSAGYQAAGDGRRFLVARRSSSSEAAITIVLNWQSSIDR